VGSQVTIPLGKQRVRGTVLRLHNERVPYPTKPLALTAHPPLTAEQLQFATWLSTTMRGSLGYTLRLFTSSARHSPAFGSPQPRDAKRFTGRRRLPRLLIEKNDLQRYNSLQKFLEAGEGNSAQALILVPEVHLAEPVHTYLSRSLKNVAVYHSECTPKELAAVWEQVYRGEPVVVIGTQKALFLPWRTLTTIVLEEEYFDTHKLWDAYPRLDNHDAVTALAAIHESQILYAGSWPSLARTYEVEQHTIQVVRHSPVVPKPNIVPLSFEDRRRGYLLPEEAITHLKEGVKKKERTIILYNQRGSWRTAVCTKCHQALRCPDCDSTVFVTGTKTKSAIQCRQCTYTGPLPTACPNCKSKQITVFGPGTAKIASLLHTFLPKANVLEIAAGTKVTASRLEAADVIVGTTALWRTTAGLNFDRALWLFPETTLLYPDYRSSERAAGLLARLQKEIPSRRRVLVVTRYADLVQSSLGQQSEKFTARLLRERARLNYPPYADLVKLSCYGRTEAAALAAGGAVRQQIDAKVPAEVKVRGPYQGFNKKDGKHFVVHLLLAGPVADLVPLYKDLAINRAELSPAQIL
jgi:primosomal protein N' (replication factor Y)